MKPELQRSKRKPSPPRRRIAVIGAGPVGLEAALYGLSLGHQVTVYESGRIGSSLRRWGHVTMFSPWEMNRSLLGARELDGTERALPPDAGACPTGSEYADRYLEPLAALVARRGEIRERTRVAAVSRQGTLKADGIGDPARASRPFRLLVQSRGKEKIEQADVVLDASGTYDNPNALGDGGIPAPGEREVERIPGLLVRHLEDLEGSARHRYMGRNILVVGSGYSAATVIRSLARLARAGGGVRVTWALRTERQPPICVLEDDPLVERRRLTVEVNHLVSEPPPWLDVRPGRAVEALRPAGRAAHVTLRGPSGCTTDSYERVLSLTGYGPDNSIYRELQIHECYATRGPMKLAAVLLGAGSGDCLAQPEAGPEALRNPEPGFFVLGSKSFGRNSAFLIRMGLSQVRDIYRLLEGDPSLDLYGAGSMAAVSGGGR